MNTLFDAPPVVREQATDRHVSMSNRLARAAHGLNLAEKRLIALCLSATDSASNNSLSKATTGINQGWRMRITALEYAEAFDLDPTTAYEQIKAAAEKLFERYVRYEIRTPHSKPVEKKFRWVSSSTYAPGDGHVELNFTPEIAPHLLGLRKHFTSYRLRQAAAFDSVYTWRLFELLKSWQSTGLFVTTIEDFWDVMEAPPSCRKDFKALRTRVIEPSVKALHIKANLLVEWKPLRAGSRRVTGLEFHMSSNPQVNLDFDGENDSPEIPPPFDQV
jgi:plasmid replication initiation protein